MAALSFAHLLSIRIVVRTRLVASFVLAGFDTIAFDQRMDLIHVCVPPNVCSSRFSLRSQFSRNHGE
jgi:hypothetical protein